MKISERLFNTIAWRLTLWFLLLSIIPIAVMVVFVRHDATRVFAEMAAREAAIQARILASTLDQPNQALGLAELPSSAITRGHSVAIIRGDVAEVLRSDGSVEVTRAEEEYGADILRVVKSGESGSAVEENGGRLVGYARLERTSSVVVVEVERAVVLAPLAQLERTAAGQLALSLAVVAIAGGVAIWIVIGPVQRLTRAAEEIGAGNLAVEIDPSEMEGELEVLASAFAQMAGQLRDWYAELEKRVADRTAELEELTTAEHRRAEQFRLMSEVGQQMTSILPLTELLGEVVRMIQETFGYSHVAIGLIEGDHVVYRSGAGALWEDPSFAFRPARLEIGSRGLSGWVAAHNEPLLVPDVEKDERYVEMEGSGTRSELVVPISSRGQVLGVLDAQCQERGAFDEMDLVVLQSLAHQTAIAIENARLYEQSQQLAVVEERQRLARDLHDSVTQAMYGVTLYAEAARRLLAAEQHDLAADHLRQLSDVAQEALREMRLLIFELRPPVLEEAGLRAALQQRLDAVEGRAGLTTELTADIPDRLPADVEEGLYRLAQEALNNSLKHAQASVISIAIRKVDDAIMLEVSDDGVGFEPGSSDSSGGLGMIGMRERAERMGGRLTLESRPGAGTLVRVEVPL